MASAGRKRSLPEEDDEAATGDRPQKKIAISQDAVHSSVSNTVTQVQNIGSVHADKSPAGDPRAQPSKPITQTPLAEVSKPRETPLQENKLPRIPKRPVDEEVPRPRKRPGAAARVDKARSAAILEKRRREEEEETRRVTQYRGGHEFVKQHYNSVPQRGREWRSTESKIKGLRKYNNWVKSVIINRFSQPEDRDGPPLKVLDLGCGKGGDLQKWNSAPHPVRLYVGVDPAEVSINQARDRYEEMRRGANRGGRGGRGGWRGGRQQAPLFDAEFIDRDAFGLNIEDIPTVQAVGFDPDIHSRWGGGGFDVVSMMFCMHYAFESEAKTKGMLRNVAGSLKKGGRFIGVIPNSDVIRSKVQDFHTRRKIEESHSSSKTLNQEGLINGATDTNNPSKAEQQATVLSAAQPVPNHDDIEPKHSHEDPQVKALPTPEREESVPNEDATKFEHVNGTEKEDSKVATTAEWGNEIYRVRFPGITPEDGVFRPPFGWKYEYFMEEAVEEVPEYVVPWEAFRAFAEGFGLEQMYRKPFAEVWNEEKDHQVFGPLSERMGVRGQGRGPLLINKEEMDAASFYHAFCFYKV